VLEFAAGRSDLAPPAREKLDTVTKALTERPELVLQVPGVFDAELDGAALKAANLEAAIDERMAGMRQDPNAALLLASEKRRAAMEALFLERYPREELDALAAAHVAPAATDSATDGTAPAEGRRRSKPAPPPPPPTIDLVGYLDAVRERLVATMQVSPDELAGLANERGQAVTGYFAAAGAIEPGRIQIKEPVAHKDRTDEWVRLRLELSAK